jgi:hypothetical protein
VPVPSQELDLLHHMLWSFFLCSMIWGEWWLFILLIHVDVNLHCLNFLFILLSIFLYCVVYGGL